MPTTIKTFLPANFWKLEPAARQAAREEAFAKLTQHKADRKVAIAAEKAQAAAKAMTCQVCNRPIFAEAGVIAHHGYTRPYEGVQTGSCIGARELPFEVSRDVLLIEIERTEHNVAGLSRFCDDIRNDVTPVTWSYSDRTCQPDRRGRYPKTSVRVTAATFDEARETAKPRMVFISDYHTTFADVKLRQLRELEARLKAMQAYLDEQRTRAQAWRHTHRVGGAGEPVWARLEP